MKAVSRWLATLLVIDLLAQEAVLRKCHCHHVPPSSCTRAEMCQGNLDPAAACQLCCDLSGVVVSAHLNYASSAAIPCLATISPLKCGLSAQLCTISSSVICQLWLQVVSSDQMQALSWATTLSINHNLSAQPQNVSSTALCQLQCSLSADLYTISSSVIF